MALYRKCILVRPEQSAVVHAIPVLGLFAIVFAVFALFRNKRLLRNTLPVFRQRFVLLQDERTVFGLLLFVTCSDFLIAQLIYRVQARWQKRAFLILSVAIDLSILCYFKYAYFFADLVNTVCGTSFQVTNLLAAEGNRFARPTVLQRRPHHPARGNLLLHVPNHQLYGRRVSRVGETGAQPVRFRFLRHVLPPTGGRTYRESQRLHPATLPQVLPEPPAIRHGRVLDTQRPAQENHPERLPRGELHRPCVRQPHAFSPVLRTSWPSLPTACKYMPIFSGYTDIAIGLSLLMGFYLPRNFNSPYKAPNCSNFWKRWHISLSRWLQNYLYIPWAETATPPFGTYFWILTITFVALILSGNLYVAGGVLVLGAVVVTVGLRCPDRRKRYGPT